MRGVCDGHGAGDIRDRSAGAARVVLSYRCVRPGFRRAAARHWKGVVTVLAVLLLPALLLLAARLLPF